jgi:hypothetical protein
MTWFPTEHPWLFLAILLFLGGLNGYRSKAYAKYRPRYILLVIVTGLFLALNSVGPFLGGMA